MFLNGIPYESVTQKGDTRNIIVHCVCGRDVILPVPDEMLPTRTCECGKSYQAQIRVFQRVKEIDRR